MDFEIGTRLGDGGYGRKKGFVEVDGKRIRELEDVVWRDCVDWESLEDGGLAHVPCWVRVREIGLSHPGRV